MHPSIEVFGQPGPLVGHSLNLLCSLKAVSQRCCCLVTQSCQILCDPKDCSMPGFPVLTIFRSLPRLMSIESVMPSNCLILYCPLLSLPSVFPSIRVFSRESPLHIMLPKYWSFSFSSSPSNEYSGLISLRIDWFDFLAVQGTLKSSLAPQFKSINFGGCSSRLRLPWNSHNNLFPK